jgi:hypothetical protein
MLKKVLFAVALVAATLLASHSTPASAVYNNPCNNNVNAITYTKNATLSEATVTLKPNYTSCDVSLNGYITDGPTWQTSGNQVLLDHVTAHLTAANPTATLKIKMAPCFVQNDLYFGTIRNDGKDGYLPHYPALGTPNLIVAFNGGHACTLTPATPTAQVQTTCGTASVTIRNDFTAAPYTYGEDVTVSIYIDGKADKNVVVASGTVSAPINYSFAEDSGDHTVAIQYKGKVIGQATVTSDCQETLGNGAVEGTPNVTLPETGGDSTVATVITLSAIAAVVAGASFVARRVLSHRI